MKAATFRPTILLAVALMVIIIMMILPVPAFVLDIGLAASFALAVLIFTVTLFVEKPLDFSAFPTILLAALMLRLSLNVSSTKLIIGEGHTGTQAAGRVIDGFASFVMNGSVFLGLVVFGVLMIVNFMVITKGAGRMAEVGARFALDGMPGKQLAIDSDLSSGAITHEEARQRRLEEQQETTFFGSLDGASKFVKGDAVAGLLITLLNLVMGLAMGVLVHGMPVGAAFETYTILTVGDGLVTQIPAVIISIAAALLLSRGGSVGATDQNLLGQLGRHPAALMTVSALMIVFAVVPGLPFLPFMTGALLLGAGAVALQRQHGDADGPPVADTQPVPPKIGDILDVDEIHVEFSPDLIPLVLDQGTGLDLRINNMREHIARSFGLILPEIRLTDAASLPPHTYVIRLHGVEQARARLQPGKLLAFAAEEGALPSGEDILEPVYGAPARWISEEVSQATEVTGSTIVTPTEVLATHLLEMVKRNLGRLLGLKALRRLLDEMVSLSDPARAAANQRLIDELVPDKVPLDCLHAVLRLLLEEQVSIRNLPLILEAVAEARRSASDPVQICELVRQRLGFQLISDLRRPDGTLPLMQLDQAWETHFETHQIDTPQGPGDVALPPDLFHKLTESISSKLNEINNKGIFPALVTSAPRRRFLRTVLNAGQISAPVLSFEEIGLEAKPALAGLVPA